MKILLDEYVARKFKNSLAGHECLTVPEAGLAGKKNGELLSIAEHQGYTIFLTMDKGVEYEQNLKCRSIARVARDLGVVEQILPSQVRAAIFTVGLPRPRCTEDTGSGC